jgi:hypothetical protein
VSRCHRHIPHADLVRRSQPFAEHGPTVFAWSCDRSMKQRAHRFDLREQGFQQSLQRPDRS